MAGKLGRLISSCNSLVNCRSFLRVHGQQSQRTLFWSPLRCIRMASTDSTSATPQSLPAAADPSQTETTDSNVLESSTCESNNEVTLASTASPCQDEKVVEAEVPQPQSNSEGNSEEKPERFRKFKMAVLLSYSGQGYYGMQMQNSGARTIENDLLEAFRDAKVIDEEGFQKPKTIKFQRAARTDKNVSAARNLISVLLPKNFDPDTVNKFLPDQIRVMDYRRVTKGFDSKNLCNARTYLYMIPTFAFAPLNEKVTEQYRITPEIMEHLRKCLKFYEGSKNHHNFTSRKKPTDPSAMRYIINFDSSEPFMKDGLEYVVLKVKGQSFMLHQIRKLIGLVVAVLRGFTNEDTMARAFTKEKIDIPMVPGLGLMLGETHYDQYNRKFGSDGMHEPLQWDNVADKIEQFCQDQIYCNVTKTENEEKSMLQWLSTLQFHTFDTRVDGVPGGFGPLGKAHFLLKKLRGEEVDDEKGEDEEEEEDTDDDGPQKKRRRD